MNSGTRWHSHFFLSRTQDWRWRRKCVPTNHRPSKESIIDGHLLEEEKKWFFFAGPASSRCSKACLYKVSRKNSKNWLRRTTTTSNLMPKIIYTLKPSNYDAQPWFLHLTALKARQGHIKHVCKISGSDSQKRRGHWRLKEFGVLCLNQPILIIEFLSRRPCWWLLGNNAKCTS